MTICLQLGNEKYDSSFLNKQCLPNECNINTYLSVLIPFYDIIVTEDHDIIVTEDHDIIVTEDHDIIVTEDHDIIVTEDHNLQ